MSINELNTESGDTLVITLEEGLSYNAVQSVQGTFDDIFKGQQIKIVVISANMDITLVKSSNLEDNTDINLRENNPALQDAWEQYQIVKNLSVKDDDGA